MRTETLGTLRARVLGGRDGRGGGEPDDPVVVLLHGFGAPGDDLVSLARATSGAPAHTRWVFPWAPVALDEALAGDGRAWWEIDMMALQMALMTGRARNLLGEVPEGLAAAREAVLGLLAALPATLGVRGLERVALGGFSQGAMLSMDVALRSSLPLAGVALLSGTYLAEREWQPLMSTRRGLRVLQSHGRRDPILPYDLAEKLRDALRDAGLDVRFVPFGGAHEIPMPVLTALGEFLRDAFAASSSA